MATPRSRPNVLITGTPGTGKTLTATEVVQRTGFEHRNVGDIAKIGQMYEGWDEKFQCHILDEDKVVSDMDDYMTEGGNVVDYHGSDMFPERWFDAVFVLRTDNTILYDRLAKRGYSQEKISNNIQCEIFQMMLDEAREGYSDGVVHELTSNLPEELDNNVDIVCNFIQTWIATHNNSS